MLSTLPQLTVYMTFQVILILCSSALDLTAGGSIFGGRHSVLYPLSNYYPKPVTYKDIRHDTVDHAYQFVKASRYGDKAAEEAILCSSTPAEVKEAGRAVVNFDCAYWNQLVKKGGHVRPTSWEIQPRK